MEVEIRDCKKLRTGSYEKGYRENEHFLNCPENDCNLLSFDLFLTKSNYWILRKKNLFFLRLKSNFFLVFQIDEIYCEGEVLERC